MLPGACWQRCRPLHAQPADQSPQVRPGLVATLVRTIFAQPDAASTLAQHTRIVEQLEGRFPAAAELLADAGGDLLAFTAFPKEHRRQLWSNNPQERLNRELRRRTDVVGSSRTARRSSAWSGRCWPTSTMSGPWPAAT